MWFFVIYSFTVFWFYLKYNAYIILDMDINDEINELLLYDADQLNEILEQELRETERVHQETD